MKTDWEAVVKDLKQTANIGQLETICELIKRHSRLTEDDLPKNAWHFVKGPGDYAWNLAYFNSGRDITHVFTTKGYRHNDEWYREHRLDLEIGPEIVPPGEGK